MIANNNTFIKIRLASNGLSSHSFSTPEEVVQHYGCMQAQDTGQAKWVIGSRLIGSTEKTVNDALTSGTIIRTWPMRGTLHYMDPGKVKWMLKLCASKTLPGFKKRREFLGISDSHAEKALDIMQKSMLGGKILTREELGQVLKENGTPVVGQWVYHLACYAATRGIICFGPPTDNGKDTFVLLDEWVKESETLNHEEQLAELARMYIRGHGPVSPGDLSWWTGLGKIECRKAFELIETEMATIEEPETGIIYYYFPDRNRKSSDVSLKSIRLLGGFDEYFLGYKDRSPIADIAHHKKLFSVNGIFYPLIIKDGVAIGSWKRTFKKDRVLFSFTFLPEYSASVNELKAECKRYANFYGFHNWDSNISRH